MASHISSISQALAGNAATLKIPRPDAMDLEQRAAGERDLSAAMASSKGTIKEPPRSGLPTPPNSISPNLPPETFGAKYARELACSPPLSQIDSDIDLQDAADDNNTREDLASAGDEGNTAEGVGAITPTLLAKNHLASMILEKGPVAIRHVMNHLAQTVPGFADIPPAKARRIVVAALENRQGGGLHGEVEFEKVGWGRWDARIKGQPGRSQRAVLPVHERPLSPPASTTSSARTGAVKIPGNVKPRSKSRRLSHGSWTGDSTLSSRVEREARHDTDVAENDADKMSIDGEEDQVMHPIHHRMPYRPALPEFYSDTDEEDWSSLDPAALRSSSFRSGGGRPSYSNSQARSNGNSKPRSFTPHTWSIPRQNQVYPRQQNRTPLDFTGVEMDSEEKSAIEALMQMGSM